MKFCFMEASCKAAKFCLGLLIGIIIFRGAFSPLTVIGANHPSDGHADLQEPSPDSVKGVLEHHDDLLHSPERRSLSPELYDKLGKKRLEWQQKKRIEFTLAYDVLVQAYNDHDISVAGTAGDLTLSGRWLLLGDSRTYPITLNFRFRDRRSYSEYAPSDIQGQTDLLWSTVKGFNDSGFQIPDLYFDTRSNDEKLALGYGQFPIDSFVDKHAMRSAKRFFLNRAFSGNPTVNFPSYGAGFVLTWKPADKWEFTGGGSNIQGTNADEVVNFGLDSTALFGTVQAAYHFNGIYGRDGRLQLMGWGSDENGEEDYNAGSGFSLTLEHGGIANNETYVLRLAQSSGQSTKTDTLAFFGYENKIRGFDSLGIGIGAGRSSTSSEWQTVLETYYRWQLTKELVVTPDLQVIFGRDQYGDSKTRIVGGIRLGLAF